MKDPGGEVDFERLEKKANVLERRIAILAVAGLLSIGAALNFGLSDKVKSAFCDKLIAGSIFCWINQ